MSRITDLEVMTPVEGGDAVLYSTTRYDGALASWDFGGPGIRHVDSEGFQRDVAAGATVGIAFVRLDDGLRLLTGGGNGGDLMLHGLRGDGRIDGPDSLGMPDQLRGDLIGAVTVELNDGTQMVYGGMVGGRAIARVHFDTDGSIIGIRRSWDSDTTFADEVVSLATADVGSARFLFTVDQADNGISSYQINTGGGLTDADSISVEDGLWIDAPTALETVQVQGQTFLVLASAGSSSLSVMEVSVTGEMRVTDHVLDDRDSRFAGATALETVIYRDQAYVIVGGADDGISIYQVLPGGRMVGVAHLADTLEAGLANVSAIAAHVSDDGVDIFVASAVEPGITRLFFDPGAGGGGTRTGSAGDDTLVGNWGNDILIDGAGSDTLEGRGGRDLFAMSADGDADTISDFSLGQDRIDLSNWRSLRNLGQLDMQETATGLRIEFGDEVLIVHSANGRGIDPATLVRSDLFSLTRVWNDAPTDPGDLVGTPAQDSLVGTAAAERIFGLESDDVLDGGGGADDLFGGAGDDTLSADDGEDRLNGGTGDDLFLVFDTDAQLIERAGEGRDRASVAVDFVLDEDLYVEVLATTSSSGTSDLSLRGNRLEQTIIGNAGDNVLHTGGGAADRLVGLGGDDLYRVFNTDDRVEEAEGQGQDTVASAADFQLDAEAEVEFLQTNGVTGTANIDLTGNAYAQRILGNAGRNILSDGGGAGVDTLSGFEGDDTYIVRNAQTRIVEGTGGGNGDRVAAGVSFELDAGDDIELLTTTSAGGTAHIDLTGNGRAQQITGNQGDNLVHDGGGRGVDTLVGGGGDDRYIVSQSDAVIVELAGQGTDRVGVRVDYTLAADVHVELLTTTSTEGTNDLALQGNAFSQRIVGNAGDNVLHTGGGAADTLSGLAGNDLYRVFNSEDAVIEGVDQGQDTVSAAVNYQLADEAHIEVLQTNGRSGTSDLELFGNAFAQRILGNEGANILADGGGAGADTLAGYGGDDVYIIRNAGSEIVEREGEGEDRVAASRSYVLQADDHIEVMTTTSVTGTAAIDLTGNNLAQYIIGNAGDNRLSDGGGGAADRLAGGDGDDRYVISNSAAVVEEYAGQGDDRVLTRVDYTLAGDVHVEHLTTTSGRGTQDIDLRGNGYTQSITGNDGANTLHTGGGAADVLIGRDGDDLYRVFNSDDLVVEQANHGEDTVSSAVDYHLDADAQVEVLQTNGSTGTDAILLRGNGYSQTIRGNDGDNVLADGGGAGADRLLGRFGDDTYIIHNAGSVIVEEAGEGTDRVAAGVSFELAANDDIEILTTTSAEGTLAIELTGNALDQEISGNAGDNRLNGGGGVDTLFGGDGADTFVFATAPIRGDADHIRDFDVSQDRIEIHAEAYEGLRPGELPADAFRVDDTGRARDEDDRIIYDPTDGRLYFDADGDGEVGRILIARMQPDLDLTGASFLVV